jgi:hypothetical protein
MVMVIVIVEIVLIVIVAMIVMVILEQHTLPCLHQPRPACK